MMDSYLKKNTSRPPSSKKGDDDEAADRDGTAATAARVEGLLLASLKAIKTVSIRAWSTPTLELNAWRGLPLLAQVHAIMVSDISLLLFFQSLYDCILH